LVGQGDERIGPAIALQRRAINVAIAHHMNLGESQSGCGARHGHCNSQQETCTGGEHGWPAFEMIQERKLSI